MLLYCLREWNIKTALLLLVTRLSNNCTLICGGSWQHVLWRHFSMFSWGYLTVISVNNKIPAGYSKGTLCAITLLWEQRKDINREGVIFRVKKYIFGFHINAIYINNYYVFTFFTFTSGKYLFVLNTLESQCLALFLTTSLRI